MKAKMIHRCIHVLDLEKSLAFYKRAFGLDVVREITRAEGSRKIVYIGNDTTDFELELVWESGRTEAYDNGSNDTHLAFAVDDVDAARLLHDEMDCVCHELGRDGIYFIEDPRWLLPGDCAQRFVGLGDLRDRGFHGSWV